MPHSENEEPYLKHSSQFKFCPLIWIFHNRFTNNRVNILHKRALYIDYNDLQSTFEEFLLKNESFSIHHQNIQRLLTEIHKTLHDIPTNIYGDLFVRNNHSFNLRSRPEIKIPSINNNLKGENSLRYLYSVSLNNLP